MLIKQDLNYYIRQKTPSNPKKRRLKAKALFNSIPVRYPVQFTHTLITSSVPRHTVILEDGSTWKVKSSDMHKLVRWKNGQTRNNLSIQELHERACDEELDKQQTHDYLMITQKTSWLRDPDYPVIRVNCTRGECVESGLTVDGGPILDGMYTNSIDHLDIKDENRV